MTKIKYISGIEKAPKAVGPYSQAVRIGDELLFLSGQVGIVPEMGTIVAGGVLAEAKQVLQNIREVLVSQGLDYSDIVKATIFLTDMADFKSVNEVYSQILGDAKPARSTVQVAALPLGAKIEIEVIASF